MERYVLCAVKDLMDRRADMHGHSKNDSCKGNDRMP